MTSLSRRGMSGWRVGGFAALAAAACVLAACSSSGGSGSPASSAPPPVGSSAAAPAPNGSASGSTGSGVEAAKQIVAEAEKPAVWRGPTESVDLSKVKGKSVYEISLTQQIPALAQWMTVTQQQLEAAGMKATICDAKGTPAGIIQCFQQGIAQRPAVILAQALDTTFIHKYIAQANAAGIKVVTSQTGVPGIPTTTGAVAEATVSYPQVGKLLAAYFAAQSNCTGYPQIITSTSSRQPSAALVGAMQKEISSLCPQVKATSVQNVLIPDQPTKLPTLTRSLLTQNSNLQYMVPIYDGMTIYMAPAIRSLGNKNVQMFSFNATPVVMQTLLNKSALTADVGSPNQWFGYAQADQVLRAAAGAAPVADENLPLRLFTADNIGSIDPKADESTWYGSVDFACNYHKLWGLPCS